MPNDKYEQWEAISKCRPDKCHSFDLGHIYYSRCESTSSEYMYSRRVTTVWQVFTSDNCLSNSQVVGMAYLVFITMWRKNFRFSTESRPSLEFIRPAI